MSNNSRKNSSAYRGIPPLECPEDFNFQSSTDRTNKMYESCNSSDESREYDQDSMETEDFFQQNQPSINMKYISKTTIKYVNFKLFMFLKAKNVFLGQRFVDKTARKRKGINPKPQSRGGKE
jgi:hypothetical protein